VVYRLIRVKMDIKDVNDFNLIHPDPIGVDNRSLGAKN